MRRPAPSSRVLSTLAAVLLTVSACSDRNPAALPDAVPPPSALAALRCAVDVRAGTLACGPEGARTPAGASAVILGNQGTDVRLASSGTSYDGASILRTYVTVENLLAQALGTTDGGTPSGAGVRVFFHEEPFVTGGSGAVSVENADGVESFTATGQPYFHYEGILPPGDTSAPKEWRFGVPSTVASFSFVVYVTAPVPHEAGWLALSPLAPALVVGGSRSIAATVRDVFGGVVSEPVSWASANTSVATVSPAGVVTGVGEGSTMILANSGPHTASVVVSVGADSGSTFPEIVELSMSPGSVAADGDTVALRVAVRSLGEGIGGVSLTLLHAAGNRLSCNAGGGARVSGTMYDGVYECRIAIPAGSPHETWTVEEVEARSLRSRVRTLATADLLDAGAPAHLYVRQ